MDDVAVLMPHLAGLRLERVYVKGAGVRIEAATRGGAVCCPDCGAASTRVHSTYLRQLADTGVGGHEVRVVLRVRRLFCDQPECPRRTFAEQVAGLTARHGRRTVAADGAVMAVAVALAGRAGARLSEELAVPVSRMTLLRMIRRMPDPAPVAPRVLGVDDFAQRRGHRYATILLDMSTHRPIDVLPDREAETLAEWLRAHPGVEIVCRDRGGAYAEGATRAAPQAIQIADRWHLMHNLSEAVHEVVTRHRGCLRQASAAPDTAPAATPSAAPSPPSTAAAPPAGRRADDARRRHQAVHALLAEGRSIKTIMRQLGLSRGTVRRYARAAGVEELLGPPPIGQAGKLAPFKPYLLTRLDEGVTDGQVLFAGTSGQGYRGTLGTLQRFLVPYRDRSAPPGPAKVPPARHITAWIMRPDDKLSDEDRLGLKNARAHCPDLDDLTTLAHGFNQLVRQRQGDRLEEWITRAANSPSSEIRGFATGLLADYDAVHAGLTQPWSSGPVEGTVNRIKTIKRQMYGRAKLDLLRKRVLTRP